MSQRSVRWLVVAILGTAAAAFDRTGLGGSFDFEVVWGPAGDAARDPSIQSPEDLASLLTAVREQLGLELQPTRAPFDVLVVDSISRPTPD